MAVMLKLIKKFFSLREATAPPSGEDFWSQFLGKVSEGPPVDFVKIGEELLSELPRCTAQVVIAGPSYGDMHYTGDVVVEAATLSTWAEDLAGLGRSFSDDKQTAAFKIFPLWLKGADLTNSSPSIVTAPFQRCLSGYALDFVMKKIARMHCPECDHFVSDVNTEMHEMEHDGVFQWFMHEWRCPAGHLMYRKKDGISVYSRKKSEISGGGCS